MFGSRFTPPDPELITVQFQLPKVLGATTVKLGKWQFTEGSLQVTGWPWQLEQVAESLARNWGVYSRGEAILRSALDLDAGCDDNWDADDRPSFDKVLEGVAFEFDQVEFDEALGTYSRSDARSIQDSEEVR